MQYVYLAVAILGLVLNVLFYFCYLPEITEEALAEEIHAVGIVPDIAPFRQQYRTIFGFVAQMAYVFVLLSVYHSFLSLLT